MESNGNNGWRERLERIEGIIEAMATRQADFEDAVRAEHKRLLTAQVLLTDEVRKLAEAQIHTDERLNALIAVVDDLVRRPRRGETS